MQLEHFLELTAYGVQTAMLVSAPVLLCGLAAGVAVSIFQAATQINDASLAFIPKIAAVAASLTLFGSWMIAKMVEFSTFALNQIANISN